MQRSIVSIESNYNLQIFNSLIGVWSLERVIDNHLNCNLSGLVKGQASITQQSPLQLYYREEGLFTANTQTKIFQEYIYRFNNITQKIEKHFINAQGLLYSLELNTLNIFNGQHLCSLDHYQAKYNFKNLITDKTFSIEYRVNGPKKNYLSQSIYRQIT